MPHTLTIDGMKFDTSDANAQAALDKLIEKLRADAASAQTAAQGKYDAEIKAHTESKASLSKLQAKHDALVESEKARAEREVVCFECEGAKRIDGADCLHCDGKGMTKVMGEPDDGPDEEEVEAGDKKDKKKDKRKDAIDRMVKRGVKARTALIVDAQRVLGLHEKLDDLDAIEIKKRVIKKLRPQAKLDGQDAVYIQARYDDAMEGFKPATPIESARQSATTRTAQETAQAHVDATDPEAARLAMIERQRNAFVKAPAGAK